MFEEISYIQIFGLPLLYWLGIIGLIFIILAAIIGKLIDSGKIGIDLKWHKLSAIIGVLFVIAHAFLAIANILF